MPNPTLQDVKDTLTDEVLESISTSRWGSVFRRLTKHERNIQIIKAYRDGIPRSIVARMFNVAPSRINNVVQAYIVYGMRVRDRR